MAPAPPSAHAIKEHEDFLALAITDWNDLPPHIRQEILNDVVTSICSHDVPRLEPGGLPNVSREVVANSVASSLSTALHQQKNRFDDITAKQKEIEDDMYKIGQKEVDDTPNGPTSKHHEWYNGWEHLERCQVFDDCATCVRLVPLARKFDGKSEEMREVKRCVGILEKNLKELAESESEAKAGLILKYEGTLAGRSYEPKAASDSEELRRQD